MPPVVRIHRDPGLASSYNPIMLFGCRLPPLCAIAPFPVALAVRFRSKIRNGLGQFHHDFILLVTMNAGYLSSLCFTVVYGVLVVPLAGVVLETLVVDASPARWACCERAQEQ